VNEWIQQVTDITLLASEIHELVKLDDLNAAKQLLPNETIYHPPERLLELLNMSKPAFIPTTKCDLDACLIEFE